MSMFTSLCLLLSLNCTCICTWEIGYEFVLYALTMNRESSYRGSLGADHVFGNALVLALISWPHVGYH